MIQSVTPVRPNDHVVLNCGTIEAYGRVVWTREHNFGIEFDAPIEEEEIVRQLDRSHAVVNRRHLRVVTGDE